MKNLTDNPASYPSAVRMPEDGVDMESAASLETGRQDLANRTAYLHKLVLEAGGAGVRRIQTALETTDMQALVPNDGDVCLVDGIGLFVYGAASTVAADGLNIFALTGGTPGRWIRTDYIVRGSPLGLASLDANGLVPDAQLRRSWGVIETGAAAAWIASVAYGVEDRVTNDGGRVYVCTQAGVSAGSGGPTGTGAAIVDGTVTWKYLAADRPSIRNAGSGDWTPSYTGGYTQINWNSAKTSKFYGVFLQIPGGAQGYSLQTGSQDVPSFNILLWDGSGTTINLTATAKVVAFQAVGP